MIAFDVPGRKIRRFLARIFALASFLCLSLQMAGGANVVIDGSQTFQTIDGFGANINHRGWNNNELKPVIDALVDQAGMTLFRVVYDNTDWETTNDNPDSNSINWNYYAPIYSGPEFQKFWDLMLYLNQKGLTNGVMPNFQGMGPIWMGGQHLNSGFEGEWAEGITSALMYARYSNHVAFNLVAPHNEPDLPGSGVGISNAVQYVATLRELAQRLDAHGLGDLRFVGPDRIFNSTDWLPTILGDSTVMSKVAHFGVHSYSNFGGGTDGVDNILKQSAYPDRNYWVTEFGVWCDVCQNTWQGTNTWDYARGTAEYLLRYLENNASGALIWEGYDGIYLNNYDDNTHPSSWGLFALDDPSAAAKTYTARKDFYTLSQISKFVRPGAQRINVTSDDSFQLLGFYHSGTGQLTLTGINTDSSPKIISATITNLAAVSGIDLYYTDANNNVVQAAGVAVVNGAFTAVVPANSVFTLVSPLVPNPVIHLTTNGIGQVSPDLSTKLLIRGKTYTLVAVPGSGQVFAGWSGDITSTNSRLLVTMDSDLNLQANFVAGAFAPMKATFNGLFYETDDVATSRSGSFTLATTASGAFVGRLQIGAAKYPFKGSFDSGGHATVTVMRHGLSALTLEMQAGLAASTDGITGTVGDGNWVAGLTADRVIFDGKAAIAPQAGKYTMAINGVAGSTSKPGGDSYFTLIVDKTGKVRLTGSLADGSKASQSALVSASGEFPIFIALNGGAETVLGWITFTNSDSADLTGSITWNKASSPKAKYYAGGFNLQAAATGSKYIPPAKGSRVLNLTDAQVVLSGGSLTSTITTLVALDSNNHVTDVNKKLRLTISTGSGLFKGSVVTANSKTPAAFGGVILQKQTKGQGFFINGNQTGELLFSAPAGP